MSLSFECKRSLWEEKKWEKGGKWEKKNKRRSYLLDVIIEGDDGKRGCEIGVVGDGGAHWCWFADKAVVHGRLEVGRLIVLIKHLNVQISEGRERVSIVLFSLWERERESQRERERKRIGSLKKTN